MLSLSLKREDVPANGGVSVLVDMVAVSALLFYYYLLVGFTKYLAFPSLSTLIELFQLTALFPYPE